MVCALNRHTIEYPSMAVSFPCADDDLLSIGMVKSDLLSDVGVVYSFHGQIMVCALSRHAIEYSSMAVSFPCADDDLRLITSFRALEWRWGKTDVLS